MRVGLGFDSHNLVEDRPLVLGGVEIEFQKGLSGHSDGDCLLHAVCDAILGAMGEGDIGELFPDTDPRWKDTSSSVFLSTVAKMLAEKKFTIANIDATVIASEPRITPYKEDMREKTASLMGISPGRINIKAKRPEGFERIASDVIAVYAVASVADAVTLSPP